MKKALLHLVFTFEGGEIKSTLDNIDYLDDAELNENIIFLFKTYSERFANSVITFSNLIK